MQVQITFAFLSKTVRREGLQRDDVEAYSGLLAKLFHYAFILRDK